jgi:hypothetical protein
MRALRRFGIVLPATVTMALLPLLAAVVAPAEDAAPAAPAAKAAPDIQFVDDDDLAPPSPAASPFGPGPRGISRQDAVPGVIRLSGGEAVPGHLYTTRAKRLKIYNLARKRYEFVPVPALASIETVIEWERQDREWRFKEAGSPEKVYTGRSYPVRMHAWRLTLLNGHEIVGHILGQPFYAERDGKVERFILHQRDKGEMGKTLADLVHIRRVEFGQEAYDKAVAAEIAAPSAAGEGKPPAR